MTNAESNHFDFRVETDAHKDELHFHATSDGRAFMELASRVFATLPPYHTGKRYGGELDPEMSWISKTFYTKYYQPPRLRRGYSGELVPGLENLLDEARKPSRSGHLRRLFFLIGDVGVGKTSLLNYLLTQRLAPQFDSGGVWFCRIDVERKADLTPNARPEFSLVQLLIRIGDKLAWIAEHYVGPTLSAEDRKRVSSIVSALYSSSQSASNGPPPTPTALYREIRNLLEFTYVKTKRLFVLILDNIDYVGHVNDRLKFHGVDDIEEKRVLRDAMTLIRELHTGTILGAAPSAVIIPMRPETHALLSCYQGTSFESLFPDAESFAVDAVDAELAAKLRCSLLAEAAKYRAISEKKSHQCEEIDTWVDTIERYLGLNEQRSSVGRPLDEVLQLSNHGLRSTLECVGRYTLAPFFSIAARVATHGSDYDMHHRLLRSRIVTMLGGKLRFSQAKSHFPNLYLAVKLHGHIGSRLVSHVHSYWLKRLIFEFLYVKKRATEKQIIGMFCASEDGYEPYIVRELLGSLYESNSSAVIAVSRSMAGEGGRLAIEHMQMLSRGLYLKNVLVDTFAYLQIVVDDYMLPIPTPASAALRFEGRPDYRYLMNGEGGRSGSTGAMLRSKAEQVITFLNVLEASLLVEKNLRPLTFAKISSTHGGVELPNVTAIRRGVEREIHAVLEAIGDTTVNVENIINRQTGMIPLLHQHLEEAMLLGMEEVSRLRHSDPGGFRLDR